MIDYMTRLRGCPLLVIEARAALGSAVLASGPTFLATIAHWLLGVLRRGNENEESTLSVPCQHPTGAGGVPTGAGGA